MMGSMEPPTSTESEAILLRWRTQHPDAPADAGPTDVEKAALLAEVRDRAAAIETEAFKMLMQAVRNQPSRSGFNSKYMQMFFLYFVVPVASIVAIVGLVSWILSFRH